MKQLFKYSIQNSTKEEVANKIFHAIKKNDLTMFIFEKKTFFKKIRSLSNSFDLDNNIVTCFSGEYLTEVVFIKKLIGIRWHKQDTKFLISKKIPHIDEIIKNCKTDIDFENKIKDSIIFYIDLNLPRFGGHEKVWYNNQPKGT